MNKHIVMTGEDNLSLDVDISKIYVDDVLVYEEAETIPPTYQMIEGLIDVTIYSK